MVDGKDKDDTSTASAMMLDSTFGICKFNGEDKTYSSAKWVSDIEDNADIFGWSAQQKLIIARRSLVGTAELWLKSEKTFKSFDELKAALLKEFPETLNSKEMHELMAKRKKKSDETCYQYMLVMRELGKRAKFPDYIAIQYIIDGIPDYESNKAILYGVTSYSTLKEKLAIYDTMKLKMKHSRENKYGGASTSKQNSGGVSKTKAPISSEKQSTVSGRMCYNCGDKKHLANQCPNGVKCFKCNSFGHLSRDCSGSHVTRSSGGKPDPKTLCVMAAPEGGATGDCTAEVGSAGDFVLFGQRTNFRSKCHCQICQRQQCDVLNVNIPLKTNIKPKSIKTVKMCGISVDSLIDTGCDYNLITSNLFFELSGVSYVKDKVILTGLGSARVSTLGKFTTTLEVDNKTFETCFYIVPSNVIPYQVILGQSFLCNATILLDKGAVKLMPQDDYSLCLLGLPTISDEPIFQIPALQELVDSYKPMKVKEAPIKLKIIMKDEIPVVQRPRRLAIREEEVVKCQIQEWLQKGIIRPSFSEYSSPLVLVKKKDGSYRVCVDYRKVNQKMVKDEFPLPVIDDHIDKLSGSRIFSTLDLKNGFFHLPVDEDSIKYTAFVTSSPEGQYEFLRAPFGLSICPKYFSRYINIIFQDLIVNGIVLIFIDDIVVLAKEENEALDRLKLVLKLASENGLEINWKKCQLLQKKIEYLGHVVENGTVKPSPTKTEAIANFPEPKSTKQVHSFVGLTSYFRKYIENYAVLARPLTELLKKETSFYFGEEERRSFDILKSKLCSDPVLKIFKIGLDTEVHTDASKYGYAAILLQKDDQDGKLHPVYYMSKKTSQTEQNYHSYELEALAVVEGVKKFRKYLFGIHFKIQTDCSAFQKTLYKNEVSAKVARWVLFLQDFDYEIIHRPGKKMSHVDSLSRIPHVYLIQSELHARICKAQKEDESLSVIREILKEKEYKDFYIQNDLIYKGADRKLVIPEVMHAEIIRRAHDVGHFGKKKTIDMIEKDFYISNLITKVEKIISGCVPCILACKKEGKQEGFLNPKDKGEIPLETLHCDHLGPLDATKKLYNYILTVIDAYTKFVWIYPTKTLTSKETVEKLKLHQKDFGNPARIITDKGTAFTGKDFQEYCQEESIHHHAVTTGIPRGNGQVERIHRVIISVLTKMCVQEPTHWYKYVSKVQRAINSTHQRSINTSPFNLFIGIPMKQKEDLPILELIEEECRLDFIDKRENLRQEAKEQMLKIQEENIKTYNKRRKEERNYEEGDIVAIRRTQFGNVMKLKPKFLGPYRVTKKVGKGRYHVEKVNINSEGPIKTSTGADCMKLWP